MSKKQSDVDFAVEQLVKPNGWCAVFKSDLQAVLEIIWAKHGDIELGVGFWSSNQVMVRRISREAR